MGKVIAPGLILSVVLSAAVVFDIRSRRIPNLLIIIGWSLSLTWHGFSQLGSWAFDAVNPGGAGVLKASASGTFLLLLLMPFYACRFMGAGDVKLLSFVGCMFGASGESWVHLVELVIVVFISGGVFSIFRVFFLREASVLLYNMKNIAIIFFAGRRLSGGVLRPVFDPRIDTADRMPYAVPIGAGVMVYSVLSAAGWRGLF